MGIPYLLRRTHIYETVFPGPAGEEPPAACVPGCAAVPLHQAAQDVGCNVVALRHHQDDAAQTFLMNLLGGGALGCFSPKTLLDRRGLTLIRPLVFLEEGRSRPMSAGKGFQWSNPVVPRTDIPGAKR